MLAQEEGGGGSGGGRRSSGTTSRSSESVTDPSQGRSGGPRLFEFAERALPSLPTTTFRRCVKERASEQASERERERKVKKTPSSTAWRPREGVGFDA